MGDPNDTCITNRTRSLRVRRCGRVVLVAGALSAASQLTDVELSDIDHLELEAHSLYRSGDRPPLRVAIQRVAYMRTNEEAFRGVKRLQQFQLLDVEKADLVLDDFPADAEIGSLRLTNSSLRFAYIDVSDCENITLAECTVDTLDITAGDVRFVTIIDNRIETLEGMRFNSRKGPGMTDADVMIARNNISSLGGYETNKPFINMTLHRLALVNNSIDKWPRYTPLHATYHIADLSGNEIKHLAVEVFSQFARVTDVNLERRQSGTPVQTYFLTFSRNTIYGSDKAENSAFLLPVDPKARSMALYRVYGNRFSCNVADLNLDASESRCWELKNLVKTGEDQPETEPTAEGLYEWRTVHGQLYRTSSCLEDGRSLQQFWRDAFRDDRGLQVPSGDFRCRSRAAVSAAGMMTLLLTAAVAVGLSV